MRKRREHLMSMPLMFAHENLCNRIVAEMVRGAV
jgi:hypothetical protein